MRFTFSVFLSVSCLISLFSFSSCQLSYCKGKPNNSPIITGAPVFVKQVANGKLYKIGKGDETISLVHVWGTPFEMGVAEGILLKEQIEAFYPAEFNHFVEMGVEFLDKYVDPEIAYYISKYGFEAGLDLTWQMVKDYTPEYFLDEMKGIASVTNVSFETILQLHMLPELVKAQCSIFDAWGKATIDGRLIQLRALDWDTTGVMQNYPVVTIYHPNADMGHAFANVGWSGWVGLLTGMSSTEMAISQKVQDHALGTTSRIGYPFHFLMRDVMQFDNDLDAAITRMINARRTVAIWLGVGDNKCPCANLFQYSHSELVVIDPNTVIYYPSNESKYEHPLIKDIVYWGINQQCLSAVLQQQYGNISGEDAILNIIPLSQTGELQAVFFDLTNMEMYVSNAAATGESGPLFAYERSFVKFDMQSLFAEKPPTIDANSIANIVT